MPLQSLALAACVTGAASSAALLATAHTGFPFGRCEFSGNAGPRWLGGFPIWLPLVWIVALLSARGTARLLLRPQRQRPNYGYGLVATTAALATVTLAALDLFAVQGMHWWRWTATGWSWEGVALPNLAGSFVVSVLALLLATPALIDKRPVQSPPALLPLLVWFTLNCAFLAGSAAHVSEAALAVVAAAAVVVTTLAFQRSRASVSPCSDRPRP